MEFEDEWHVGCWAEGVDEAASVEVEDCFGGLWVGLAWLGRGEDVEDAAWC